MATAIRPRAIPITGLNICLPGQFLFLQRLDLGGRGATSNTVWLFAFASNAWQRKREIVLSWITMHIIGAMYRC